MAVKKSTFKVKRLGCAACAAKVQSAVAAAQGIVSAEVSREAATLSVEFDDAVISPEQIREVVRNAGYDLDL